MNKIIMSKHQHYWLETGIPHILVALNGKFRYDCSVCNKQKYFRQLPINPVVPSAQDVYENQVAAGNAHLVMSPPLILGKESQFTEGLRYAKLVKGDL